MKIFRNRFHACCERTGRQKLKVDHQWRWKKNIQQEKNFVFNKLCWKTWISACRRVVRHISYHIQK